MVYCDACVQFSLYHTRFPLNAGPFGWNILSTFRLQMHYENISAASIPSLQRVPFVLLQIFYLVALSQVIWK